MKRLLLLLATLFAAQAGAEGGPGTPFSYPQAEWPTLTRVAQQTPGFAGFTYGQKGTQLQLTDPSQEARARAVLKADLRWQKYIRAPGTIKAQYDVTRLVNAAQRIKAARPQTRVLVSTLLNRMTLNTSVEETARLARQFGVSDLVISEQARPRLRATISPTTVSLRDEKADHFGVRLRLRITNVVNHPTLFGYGCGGNLTVRALTLRGDRLPDAGRACTQEARMLVMFPGQSYDFPGFSTTKLSALKPGRHLWDIWYTGQRIPFTLTP